MPRFRIMVQPRLLRFRTDGGGGGKDGGVGSGDVGEDEEACLGGRGEEGRGGDGFGGAGD